MSSRYDASLAPGQRPAPAASLLDRRGSERRSSARLQPSVSRPSADARHVFVQPSIAVWRRRPTVLQATMVSSHTDTKSSSRGCR